MEVKLLRVALIKYLKDNCFLEYNDIEVFSSAAIIIVSETLLLRQQVKLLYLVLTTKVNIKVIGPNLVPNLTRITTYQLDTVSIGSLKITTFSKELSCGEIIEIGFF